jgi:hypothetical protein
MDNMSLFLILAVLVAWWLITVELDTGAFRTKSHFRRKRPFDDRH